uniref:Cadherin domain-containing protein n=1 Tax=Ditylenchus dipsaci TaxID=166011 RepID=A0A915CVR1_9BILA
MDFDADACLIYRIVEADCLTVLGQPIQGPACKDLFRFQNAGLRNGSITLSKRLNENESTIEDGSIQNKIFALAVVHLNISVSDSNHPLEPSAFASYIIRIKPKKSTENQSHDENDQMTRKFSFPSSDHEIHVSDNLPPNSYIYTFIIFPMVNMNSTNIGYSLVHAQKLFALDSHTGILTSIASLKEIGRENVSVAVKLLNTDQLIDTTTLTVVVQSNKIWLPEFRQQFYLFEANAANQSENSGVVIGQVNAEDKEGDVISHDIVYPGDEQHPHPPQQPFIINSKNTYNKYSSQKKLYYMREHYI